MAMVWLCRLDVAEYAELGREIEAPTPNCPLCSAEMGPWHGYQRHLRGKDDRLIWVPRVRCRKCQVTQALLPWFVLPWRWDEVDVIGRALEMAAEEIGVRTIAAALERPLTTVRGWVRRFRKLAETLAGVLLTVASGWGWRDWELPTAGAARCLAAANALSTEWRRRYGVGRRWQITNLITGGRMLSCNTSSLLAASPLWSWMASKTKQEVPNGP
jgi:transposase-like protein